MKLIKYIIRVFSFLKAQRIEDKKAAIKPILDEMRKLPFGHYYAMLKLESDKDVLDQLKRGFSHISLLGPLIGLEFLDKDTIVSRPTDLAANLSTLCSSETWYQYVIGCIPTCKSVI